MQKFYVDIYKKSFFRYCIFFEFIVKQIAIKFKHFALAQNVKKNIIIIYGKEKNKIFNYLYVLL